MEQFTKTCGHCNQDKALNEFSPDARGRQGRDNTCKECRRVAAAERRATDPESVREAKRRYNAAHPGREQALARARYAADPEPFRAKSKRWADKNRDRVAGWRQAYYANEANRERIKARRVERYRENPAVILEYNRQAHARRRGAAGSYTIAQLQARWDFYGGRCWMCGAPATTIDHVIAVKRGGSNWPANLRPACASCNSSKRHSDWRLY